MNKNLVFSLKSIGYVLLVNVISALNGVAYIHGYTDQMQSLLIQIGIFAILAPVYFFVKGKVEKPWLYVVVTFILHAFMGGITYFVMHFIYFGANDMVYFYINLFTLIFYIGVAGCDIIYMCLSEFKKH